MLETTLLTGRNYIGFATSSEGGERYHAVNASTGEQLMPSFALSTADERALAAHRAGQAFFAFAALPPESRAAFLDKVAEEIESLGDALLERANLETALPIPRLTGERARTTGQLRMFASLIREGSWVDARIDTAQPERQPLPKPDIRRMLAPIGPIVVFGASNFPLAFSVAGGDTASALAAGCPVIVKAHPAHPGTSELVAQAVLRAAKATGMPDGVFSMVHADEAGSQDLVRRPEVKGVGFTGSKRGGRALFDVCASREEPIPCFAEMGSVNPIFLHPAALDARAEAIGEGYAASLTLGVGQFCTNPGLVFAVQGEGLTRFMKTVEAKLAEVKPATMLTEGICHAYQSGAERLFGHEKLRLEAKGAGSLGEPHLATPALFSTDAETFLSDSSLAAEVFGPCAILVVCESAEQMLQAAEGLEGQLTASIHGPAGDVLTGKLLAVLQHKAGRVVFDGFPTGVEVCPSLQHGGPYPAATDSRFTSVGTAAIFRWARPVCYQNAPAELLPPELRSANEKAIWRTVNGELTKDDV